MVVGGGDKGRNNEMKRLPLPIILAIFVLPIVVVATYLIVREFNSQTTSTLNRREVVANLGALLIHEKFDGIIDVGTSLASRTMVYQNVEKGNWDTAIKTLEGIPQAFTYIEMVGFFDTEGVLKAVIPQTPELVGKNFAQRDYYQGVSKEWKPYVSEAFKRSVYPKYNVVSVAIPVKSPEQKILGVLLLTVNLDAIVSWSEEISLGSGGHIYIVDKKGQFVVHPHLENEDNLIDFSDSPVVQKLLKGEHGVGVFLDPVDNNEDLIAYAPVQDYGFGVMVAQKTDVAFSERKSTLIEYVLFWMIITFSANVFLYRILKDRITLKTQRDHERVMLDSIGDGVVAIDRDWKIILWNKSASVITGYSKEEAFGKPFREIVKFIRGSDRKESISFIEDAIVMNRVASMDNGILLVKKDGSEVSVDDSAAPVIGLNGEVEGAIVVFHDATKEHESMHLRSDFMYASHQLRTPITEALWNLEIGIEEQDANKKNEDLRVAHQSLLSVKKLSEHLVDVSEIDQGNISVKFSDVKLIDVLTEVQNKLVSEARKRGVNISISPVSPIMAINTDGKMLNKILFEVMENAVMYSRREANVTVKTTLKEKELLIEVADTGVGILEQEQVLIFTKFFRGSNRGSENIGDGLGLYLAKAYTVLLGGKIWFESTEGKGTTFFISVPIG